MRVEDEARRLLRYQIALVDLYQVVFDLEWLLNDVHVLLDDDQLRHGVVILIDVMFACG